MHSFLTQYFSLFSFNQHVEYNGPEINHNFSTKRPNTLKVCDEERFNTSIEVYKMCTKAQQAAENFAEQFAKKVPFKDTYEGTHGVLQFNNSDSRQ